MDKMNRLIKLVSELVYYSQIHTVKGVRPANMQTHEQSWREAQQWLWDNCDGKDGEYTLKLSSTPPVEENGLPKYCKDKKRGKDDVCKYPIGSCEQCKNIF